MSNDEEIIDLSQDDDDVTLIYDGGDKFSRLLLTIL